MNRLYFGDNLKWLSDRKEFPDASVDLVYLDPPFNSNADYNVLFREPSGQVIQAQFHAFTDTGAGPTPPKPITSSSTTASTSLWSFPWTRADQRQRPMLKLESVPIRPAAVGFLAAVAGVPPAWVDPRSRHGCLYSFTRRTRCDARRVLFMR